jgi:SAM-dependent methyltransferase
MKEPLLKDKQPAQPQDGKRQAVYDWFEQPLGRSIQAIEVDRLRPVLASLYAVRAVQVGSISSFDLFGSCDAPSRYIVDPVPDRGDETRAQVRALPEALPFDSKSIDLMLLPHTLDFSDHPHQVLREAERVLIPEGHVVILGFNPVSLWGLRRLFTRRGRRAAPWDANFIGLRRIKDWLALMHFEITGGSMLYYRPPMTNSSLLDRLIALDKIGDRWWPMMAGVYLLVARKRVAGLTPIRPQWRLRLVKDGLGQVSSYRGLGKVGRMKVIK